MVSVRALGLLCAAMTAAYFEDTDRLGLGRPDAEPMATETIGGIVALIGELIEGGHAYESGGDVYFRSAAWATASSPTAAPRTWTRARRRARRRSRRSGSTSPSGRRTRRARTAAGTRLGGRVPGLAHRVLGDGRAGARRLLRCPWRRSDLVFPHHENEIAQSEAAGRPFARVWMHNGMVETDGEKMSKSEGNIFQLSEALDRYGREAVVAYLISGHYRQPLAFGDCRWRRRSPGSSGCGTSSGSTRERGGPGGDAAEQQRGGSGESFPGVP